MGIRGGRLFTEEGFGKGTLFLRCYLSWAKESSLIQQLILDFLEFIDTMIVYLGFLWKGRKDKMSNLAPRLLIRELKWIYDIKGAFSPEVEDKHVFSIASAYEGLLLVQHFFVTTI
ncbi:hypothetical protein ACJX0J_022632, partial [Zea mays]